MMYIDTNCFVSGGFFEKEKKILNPSDVQYLETQQKEKKKRKKCPNFWKLYFKDNFVNSK